MDSRASDGRILCYEDGKVIFEEDSIGKDVYIIESGKVEICKRINGKNVTIRILGKGELLGESVMFANIPRSVTAVAIGRTLLISMSMEELVYRIQNNLEFAIELIQNLVHRMQHTDIVIKTLISKIYEFSEGIIQEAFPDKRPIKLGEVLIEMGHLTPSQLDRCLQKQKETHIFEYKHKLLGEIMLEMCLITEEQLREALAEQKMMPNSRIE
jgi:CRP-like cAMP-binding protein